MLCLQKLPPRAPKDKFPGALSRFDDFVAFHMTEAMMLHDPVGTDPTGYRTPKDSETRSR